MSEFSILPDLFPEDNQDPLDSKRKSFNKEYYTHLGFTVLQFLIYTIIFISIIFLSFSYSGLLLFVCKLAQSNILPTELNCAPYTSSQPNIAKTNINIFPQTVDDQLKSIKLDFPADDKFNSSNVLLDLLRKYKELPSSNFLVNYFIAILEQMICFDFTAINVLMNLMNYILPETFIVLFGPILFSAAQGVIGSISAIYLIYLFFLNMSWFFKTNTNTTGTGPPKWETITVFSPISYFIAIILIGIVVVLGYYGYKFFAIVPGLILVYCLFSCFFYKVKMNGKTFTAFKIITHTLTNYKFPIVLLSCIAMVLLSFLILGITPGIFSIVILLLMIFNVIPIHIFATSRLPGLSPMNENENNYSQAIKTCRT